MRFLSLLGIALCLGLSTSPAQAKRPIPKTNAEQLIYFLNSETAFKDYALQCAGCHRFDGAGAKHSSVPDFNHSIGLFTRFPEGRSEERRVGKGHIYRCVSYYSKKKITKTLTERNQI